MRKEDMTERAANRNAARRRLAAVMLALAFAPASAIGAAAGGEPCAGDAQRVGSLGIVSLDCDCVYSSHSRSTEGRLTLVRRWTFRSEPTVGEIRAGGPADGKLHEGDVITAVDGTLITTRDGGRRFADVAPGATVTLTVRREGREIPVRIVAGSSCPEAASWPETGVTVMTLPATQAPIAPSVPQTPQPPSGPELAQALEAAHEAERAARDVRRARRAAELPRPAIPTEDALPRGWSGFGLTCSSCGGRPGGEGEAPAWEFGTLPTIYYLDPGSPAARAGLQIGDVLTQLDGVSLLTEDGGRRFGGLQPGQNVRWTILRGGRVRTLNVITEPRPGETSIPLADIQEKLRALSEHRDAVRMGTEMRRLAREMEIASVKMSREASRDHLRYAGAVGGSEVEVRGLENVIVDDSGDEIVITTRDATIRIKKTVVGVPRRGTRAASSK